MSHEETCGFCLDPECQPTATAEPLKLMLTGPYGAESIGYADSMLHAAKQIQLLVRSFATVHGGCLGDSQCYFAAPDSEADGDNITVGEFAKHFIEEGFATFGEFAYWLPAADDDESGYFVTVTSDRDAD